MLQSDVMTFMNSIKKELVELHGQNYVLNMTVGSKDYECFSSSEAEVN